MNALDEACVVRKPIRPPRWTSDFLTFFIQHPDKGWLAIAAVNVPFSALDPAQLFESGERAAFEAQLSSFCALYGTSALTHGVLGKLIVLWKCSPEEIRTLSGQYRDRYGVRFLSKKEFIEMDAELLSGLLVRLSEREEQSLLGSFFPEAEIPAAYVTRRSFYRDNSAKLTRFFLDSQQEWASKLDLELPEEQAETMKSFSVRLVNGVAGSGKTLIIVHRALLLAEMFPSQRILLLSHNTPIVADIKERLHRRRGGIPRNLEIATFFGWARGQWRNIFQVPLQMSDSGEVLKLIQDCRKQWPDLIKLADKQLEAELDFINDSLIASEAQYLDANRAGRGFGLKSTERAQVWALYEAVTAALRKSGRHLWSAIASTICLAQDHSRLRKYHHILIDEAQFFAPSWFQVARLSMEPAGHLFLCADPNQGFLKSKLSWKAVGIDVAGRTKKLRKSYRTTKAILAAASCILAQFAPSDPDDFLEPDYAGMEPGTKPVLVYTDSPQDAVDRVVGELTALIKHSQLSLSHFLVIYGNNVHKVSLYERLGKRFGSKSVWWLNKQEQKKQPPNGYGQDYLRLASLETATGLEGGVVFLLGVESLFAENCAPGLSREEQAASKEESARKLYMAMTRTGQYLVLVSARRLPANIEGLFERKQ